MKIRKFLEMERMAQQAGAGSVLASAGPDLYQSVRLERSMIHRFRDEMSWEIIRMEGSQLGKGDLRRILLENSLFSKGKLLLISGAHNVGASAASELLGSIESGISDCAVFLYSHSIPRDSAFLRKLEKRVPVFTCYEPFEGEMQQWTKRLAAEESIKLTKETAGLLAEYSGRSLRRLAGAIEKLALYHGAGSTINRDMMLEVLSGRDRADIFHLGDMIFGNHRGRALEAVWSLMRYGEEPVRILSYLSNLWQKMVTVRETVDKGGGKKEVAYATGARFPLLDRLMKFSRTAPSIDPAVAAEIFAEADTGLKTGVDGLLVFARFVFALTTERS